MTNDDSRGGTPEPAADGEEPIRIGGYELLGELGHGAQATIFVATQLSTGRKVAMKFMYGGRIASSVERSRLEQEIHILAALDHPNIVSVIDRGETADGSIYFIMPYVQGRTLNEFLDDFRKQNGQPGRVSDISPLLKIFVRICDAINAAHLRGIVHRDLKPSNIVVDSYGEPHILDFGLAHNPLSAMEGDTAARVETKTGEFVGSMQWASPEQAEGAGARVDIRSDVYSLGVILYELLTGDFPYDVFGSLREVMNNIVGADPIPPSRVIAAQAAPDSGAASSAAKPMDEMLDMIVLKALNKKPEDRYQSAGEFSKAVTYYLSGYETVTHRAPEAAPNRMGKRRGLALAVALAIGLGLAAGLLVKFSRSPEKKAATSAMETESVGYVLDGEWVEFKFDPDEYDNVRLPDGRFDRLTAWGAPRKVVVAGPFNDWGNAPGEWSLKKDAAGVFRARLPLKLFAAHHVWPFKFVVNGTLWVGAPSEAPNRELVVTDMATYNLLLFNPAVPPDQQTIEMKSFRERVNKSWPGQGANLTRDAAGGYHFIFNYLPPGFRVGNLEPLSGIPLVSLDLGDTKIADFQPLRNVKSLQTLVVNDGTYGVLTTGLRGALQADDFDKALDAARKAFGDYEQTPAFAGAMRLLVDGINVMMDTRDGASGPPPGAVGFNGHHYAYVPKAMLWSGARDYAAQRGAHLAAVGSADEQTWLTKTFGLPSLGRRIWLGGSDENNEGFWTWVNGERWLFENWTRPEPDNAGQAENCLAMKFDGWWTDNDGALQRPSIIEWDQ